MWHIHTMIVRQCQDQTEQIVIAIPSRKPKPVERGRTLHRGLDGDGGAAGLAKAGGEGAAGEKEWRSLRWG